ncbi:hypothetical protein CRX69_23820 [Pseudomonas rhizophila]|uniref:Transposase n=1 Tax=Pseudomonas rhizophila TaxID=2045200 RepID=A0ABM6UKK4_9PSED|nr:hypothetical protein CRX69_23820 [Pseudomonas rhizophila]
MGMPPRTLRVLCDAERHWMHSHAERGNDRLRGQRFKRTEAARRFCNDQKDLRSSPWPSPFH